MVVARAGEAVTWPAPVVFFGSPGFAVPSLETLAGDARFDVRLAVTQPPKPVGRGGRMARSAVHEAAEQLDISVWTPERLRGAAVLERLRAENAALHVVAAYGKILRRDVLDIPAHGTLNVHASLLPAYRGASPITAAILDGAAATGVTIMLLDEGLDTGPMLGRAAVAIS
jgi:methionyl-tRNA formyltransferase